MAKDTTYNLAYLPVEVERNPMEAIGMEVLETDVLILEAMYGEGSVERLDPSKHGNGGSTWVSPESEFERLTNKYGVPPDSEVTWATQVYGNVRSGMIENVIIEAAEETDNVVAMRAGQRTALAARQSANAKQVAPTTDPGDGGAQGEVDGGRGMPTKKDQLRAELESRNLKVLKRDTVSHLETMTRVVAEIEELGATPQPGAGLDELSAQLAAVNEAAAGQTDGDPQADLEAAANA